MADKQSLTSQAFSKAIIMTLMIVPTAVSIYIALSVKNTQLSADVSVGDPTPVVCFEQDVCAIQVQDKWFRIQGVIDMETLVPEEYQFDKEEPEPEPENTEKESDDDE